MTVAEPAAEPPEATLTEIDCPLCGAQPPFRVAHLPSEPDTQISKYGGLYGDKTRSDWRICSRCGFVHQNPRPTPQALRDFYESGAYHADEIPEWYFEEGGARFRQFGHWYFDEKVKYVERLTGLTPGRVFEVGSGHGGALVAFDERGWTVAGAEPDPSLHDFSTSVLGFRDVHNGLLAPSESAEPSFDLVFSNHVFEHVAELHDVVEAMTQILRPNGYVFTVVPTYYANRSKLSLAWMNASHYSMFTAKSLSQLFARHGFRTVASTYRGWWKEIDEVWHLAQLSDQAEDPATYFERAADVDHYLRVVNPRRSRLLAPFFSHYPARVTAVRSTSKALRLLVRSPRSFSREVRSFVQRRRR